MKKNSNIAILLVLSILLSVFAPGATYALDDKSSYLVEYLREGSYTTETKENHKYIVNFNEKDILDGINTLNGKMSTRDKNIPKLKLVLEVLEVDGFNVDYVFTGESVKAIEDNNINIEIRREDSNMYIDEGSFRHINLDGVDSFKLKVDQIPNMIAVDKVRDQDAMKQAFDIYGEVEINGSSARIKDPLKPIRIEVNIKDIGNPNLLAFYNIQRGMDFITGKVKNNSMTYDIKKFGEYALVETYFTFTDTKNHWGRYEIKSMTAKNVVNGVGGGLFQPNENVTREEFAKMLVLSLEIDLLDYDNNFKDINKSDWSAPYVATAYKHGIIKGKEKDMFKPKDYITRQEMSAMVARLDKNDLSDREVEQELSKYKDNEKISNWAKPFVAKASRLGFITGKKNGLDPKASTTRAEAATTISRIYNRY